MSKENVERLRGVRIPLPPETSQHRSLDARILARFPALVPPVLAAWARLPRHSRLRRTMLVRLLRQGYAAANRRDFDVTVRGYDPGCYEYRPGQVALPDSDPVY